MATAASLLNEYGAALRGSWGTIDGRSEQIALAHLADAIVEHGNDELPEAKTVALRNTLDVCPSGGCHWTEFCDAECNPDGM